MMKRTFAILDFTDRLVWELLHSNYPNNLTAADEKPLNLPAPKRARVDGNLECVCVSASITQTAMSTLTPESMQRSQHTRIVPSIDHSLATPRTTRRTCEICKSLTRTTCEECGIFVCDNAAGRNGNKTCWSAHIRQCQK